MLCNILSSFNFKGSNLLITAVIVTINLAYFSSSHLWHLAANKRVFNIKNETYKLLVDNVISILF